MDSLANDTYHWGLPHDAGLYGEYRQQHNVIISDTLTFSQQVGTVAHEATHHTTSSGYGGFQDNVDPQPMGVIACIQGANQDDDDNGGGGGGGGGGGSGGWLSPGMLENCQVLYESSTSCITVLWETGGLSEWCVMVDYGNWGGGVEEVCVTDDDGDGYFEIRTCSYTGYWIEICTGGQAMSSNDVCVDEEDGTSSSVAVLPAFSLWGTSIYCPPCDFDCKLSASEVVRWSGGLVE